MPILDGCPCSVPFLSGATVIRGCLVGVVEIIHLHDPTCPQWDPSLVLLVEEEIVITVRRMCRPAFVLLAVTTVRVDWLVRLLLLLLVALFESV